ncbi:MAG: hypothetical protein S4CHLAM7_01660 [Chlamydiae bacterium]|nr:hypothetical protein [Chlamydiota bacterium]
MGTNSTNHTLVKTILFDQRIFSRVVDSVDPISYQTFLSIYNSKAPQELLFSQKMGFGKPVDMRVNKFSIDTLLQFKCTYNYQSGDETILEDYTIAECNLPTWALEIQLFITLSYTSSNKPLLIPSIRVLGSEDKLESPSKKSLFCFTFSKKQPMTQKNEDIYSSGYTINKKP